MRRHYVSAHTDTQVLPKAPTTTTPAVHTRTSTVYRSAIYPRGRGMALAIVLRAALILLSVTIAAVAYVALGMPR